MIISNDNNIININYKNNSVGNKISYKYRVIRKAVSIHSVQQCWICQIMLLEIASNYKLFFWVCIPCLSPLEPHNWGAEAYTPHLKDFHVRVNF